MTIILCWAVFKTEPSVWNENIFRAHVKSCHLNVNDKMCHPLDLTVNAAIVQSLISTDCVGNFQLSNWLNGVIFVLQTAEIKLSSSNTANDCSQSITALKKLLLFLYISLSVLLEMTELIMWTHLELYSELYVFWMKFFIASSIFPYSEQHFKIGNLPSWAWK